MVRAFITRKSLQIVLIGAFLCSAVICRAESSLIDFDQMDSNFRGWRVGGTDPDKWRGFLVKSLETDNPHSGHNCLRVEFPGNVDGTISIWTPPLSITEPEISIRFFVRSEGFDHDGHVGVDGVTDEGERKMIWQTSTSIPHSNDWIEVKWTGTIGEGLSEVKVGLVFSQVPEGSILWIDDLEVTSIPSGN